MTAVLSADGSCAVGVYRTPMSGSVDHDGMPETWTVMGSPTPVGAGGALALMAALIFESVLGRLTSSGGLPRREAHLARRINRVCAASASGRATAPPTGLTGGRDRNLASPRPAR